MEGVPVWTSSGTNRTPQARTSGLGGIFLRIIMAPLSFSAVLRCRWWRTDLEVALGRVRRSLLQKENQGQDIINFLEERLLVLFGDIPPEVSDEQIREFGLVCLSQEDVDYSESDIQQECWARKLDESFSLFQEFLLERGCRKITEDVITEFCASLRQLAPLAQFSPTIDQQTYQTIEASAVCEEDTAIFHVEVQARASGGGNNRALQGVMFRVNEPSEAIPNVGPGLPLYIPERVALAAIQDFNRSPKPFDAHDSLTDHSLTNIVGVADRAELRGRDVVVKGWLFDFNQPTRVQQILANQRKLGMSINASAAGHPSVVDGQQVWVVDQLHIYGANLLYAKRATYQRTSIAAGAKKNSDSFLPGEEPMDDVIQAQLKMIGEGVSDIGSSQAKLSDTLAAVQLRLSALEAKDKQEMTEIEASRQREEQEAQRKEFIKEIVGSVIESLPSDTKRGGRRTVPISARGNSEGGSTDEKPGGLMLQLSACKGAIEALRSSPAPDNAKIYELIDQKRELEFRIAHAQGGE